MLKITLTSKEKERYGRQILLSEIGNEGQQKIKNAKLLVVGAGGLGSTVLTYLTAAGIGKIGIIDNDSVSESNLHRQVIYKQADVGKPKVELARKHLSELNSNTNFETYQTFLSKQNAIEIIKNYDIVVDCCDNLPTRYLINDACVICNKPFVYGSVYKYEGQVSVFNFKNGPTYRCLYPQMSSNQKQTNPSFEGITGIVPSVTGSLQTNEVIKMICNFGNILSGKLLIINTLNYTTFTLTINKNQKNLEITAL